MKKKNKGNDPMKIIGPLILSFLLLYCCSMSGDHEAAWVLYLLTFIMFAGTVFNIYDMTKEKPSSSSKIGDPVLKELEQRLLHMESLSVIDKMSILADFVKLSEWKQREFLMLASPQSTQALAQLINTFMNKQ